MVMKMNNHTIEELHTRQALPLSLKIALTKSRIRQWVNTYGDDGVYISFSGGKDSTVLLDIARSMYPNLLAVFVDTGLEYPEIRDFVKTFDNVEWLKPKKNFRQVITEYGYPFISKEVSDKVSGARRYLKSVRERERPIYAPFMADLLGIDRRENKDNPDYQALLTGNIPSKCKGDFKYRQVMGYVTDKTGKPSRFNCTKYQFFLDAPFEISAQCCNVMKKSPVHIFGRKSGRKPMTAQMACESTIRTQKWLQHGCNGFDMKSPISNPMSFWTEQDVLLYIKLYNIPIASVYGDIVAEDGKEHELSADFGIFDRERPLLKTTGCKRTGCMFCGYGCHLEKQGEGRFLKMKETHPKQYEYIMRPTEQGGLGYKKIIDWINEHGHFNIEY